MSPEKQDDLRLFKLGRPKSPRGARRIASIVADGKEEQKAAEAAEAYIKRQQAEEA